MCHSNIMAEMVAEAFLGSLFGVVLDRLASSNFIDYFRRVKLDTLVDKLESTLNSINQVLDDAEKKQYENPNVKMWLGDVKHATYEADQLLDEIATDAPMKKLKAESQPSTSNILNFIPTFTNPFESRIKELIKSLDSLAQQIDMLELNKGTCARNVVGVSLKPSEISQTTSLVNESHIYGRDGYKEDIIKYLLADNYSDNQVSVTSIVGLGGMGKTTLAQLVYNDPKIQERFELKAWVYVSEYFNVIGLTKTILWKFDSAPNSDDLDLLQRQLQKILTGKNYLLVVDDVWNKNEESWEQLLLPFNHGSSTSKIIVTTRDKEVASIMKSTKLVDLKQLEMSDCWSLFARLAFYGRNVSEYPNLESIGKNIVDKCGGLPLAVKILGNLLPKKFSPCEWIKILEADMWHLSDGDSNINSALRLSYHNLPSNLKCCFAYCSIFPKGYVFDKDKLIKLWMAEGLLKCCGRDKSEEELGYEFFDDLESISFFQQSINPRHSGLVLVMHDLVNDLAKSVSGEFCLLIEGDRVQGIPERTRHIWCSFESKDARKILEHVCKIDGLRSLMVHPQKSKLSKPIGTFEVKGTRPTYICNIVQHNLYSSLKCMRMLSFRSCHLLEIVDEISNLKLLRYLDVSHTSIQRLPDSMCKLYNLQTLILEFCQLSELPSDFYKLTNLHHLNLEGTKIKKMPKQIGRLHNLQTLTYFVVGKERGYDIKELAELKHLQGKLCISGLENVINPEDAAKANLKDKKLEELCMKHSFKINYNGRQLDVFDALQPNRILKRLTIECYRDTSFPNWIRGCDLPNLVCLELRNCGLCSRLPPLGHLPSLKELSVSSCDGIEIIGEEFYGNNSSNVPFRSLEVLRFSWMSKWKEWLCFEGFPLLKELSIECCPKLERALPQHLPSLQKLNIFSCGVLEASIPKATNIIELEIEGCQSVLVNKLPSTLKMFVLHGNRLTEFSVEQHLFNNVILNKLKLDFSGFVECPSFDLRCYNSLRQLYIKGWRSSSLPFALHLFTNLDHLVLFDCPQLESFPLGGLPTNLSTLEIYDCPKLIASRREWGLFELNSLQIFRVSDDFENMESFPEESLLPPTLDTIDLYNCSKLRIMNYKGFIHLKSLKHLRIHSCPSLERLPEDGIPNSLYNLYISDCSLLSEQYQKDGGHRWHTICRIPNVKISERRILRLL